MFDLHQSIAEWRQQMRATGIETPDVLDELESHLREDAERQTRSGSGAQEAFEAAARQIGQLQTLKLEFAKNSAPNETARKLMGFLGVIFVVFIVWMSAYTLSQCELSLREQLFAFAAVSLTMLAACGWRYIVTFLPVIPNKKRRFALGIGWAHGMPLVWGIFFGQFVLPSLERHLSADQMLIAALWAVFPATVLMVLGLGMALSERDREFWGIAKSFRQRNATVVS